MQKKREKKGGGKERKHTVTHDMVTGALGEVEIVRPSC